MRFWACFNKHLRRETFNRTLSNMENQTNRVMEKVLASVLNQITLGCWMKSPFCANERRSVITHTVPSPPRNADPAESHAVPS